MKYDRFEDLPVWKAAVEVMVGIDSLTRDRALRSKGDLANQLERAALSISNNIAEGFERGSTAELIYYLYVARGSAGEVRSALRVCLSLSSLEHLHPQANELIAKCEGVSRQLRGWADSLQNTDIKGQRHLNDATRGEWDRARRSEAFLQKLQAIRQRGSAASDPPDATPKSEI